MDVLLGASALARADQRIRWLALYYHLAVYPLALRFLLANKTEPTHFILDDVIILVNLRGHFLVDAARQFAIHLRAARVDHIG